MDKRIFKYELKIVPRQDVAMPINADILSVQFQGRSLCLWALVNPESATEKRKIEVFGTGHHFPSEGLVGRKYLATVQADGLVWHVFENV